MIDTWRNLLRRRLRTFLTVLGIVVGTLALTVMGAMSEKINALVDGALRYYGTRIVVQTRTTLAGPLGALPLSTSLVEEIKGMEGVDAVFPAVYLFYRESEEDTTSPGIGFPPLVVGADAVRFDYEADRFPVRLSSGRLFTPGEQGVAVVGPDLARYKAVALGDSLKVQGREFTVIGLIQQTLTPRDNMALIPLADAQELLARTLPAPFNQDPASLTSQIEVYPKDFEQADLLAQAIRQEIPGVHALPPGEMRRRFAQNLVIFNVIIVSSAVIAVVVGGLSILNTMAMAVSERTREIGIKKAVGATNGHIFREFLQEAAVMGFLGGLLGLALGALLVTVINTATARQGVVIFLVTPRLSALVLLFATFLGAFAGWFPALAAAQRRPVEALRAE